MIHKLFFLFFSIGIFANGVYGQESYAYKSKLQTQAPLIAVNIPITKLLKGTEIDYLFRYDDFSFYWKPISISYFFHKHWGLDFNYQLRVSERIKNGSDNLMADAQSKYSNNCYVKSVTGANDWNSTSFLNTGPVYLGFIYRFETNKIYVYPKFSIGMIGIDTDFGCVYLKEKNSNNEYTVSYSSGKNEFDTHFYFTLAPSVSFGYKIFRRFYFNAEIILSYFKPNIVFEKEFKNLYTNKSTVEYFDYKKDIFTLSFGTGIIYVIRFNK